MSELSPYRQLSIDQPVVTVVDIQDISQCIRVICGTQKGSDPLRPNFGIDKLQFIDRPVNAIVPLLVKEITNQIAMWEPRATVRKIAYKIQDAQIIFTINWYSEFGTYNTTINA